MNKILVLIVGLISSITVFGQDFYYNGMGEKIYLTLNPNKIVCYFPKVNSAENLTMRTAYAVYADKKAVCKGADIVVYNYPIEMNIRQTMQKLVSDTTENNFRIWSCYKWNDNDWVLTDKLYIILKEASDYYLVQNFMEKYKLEMDHQSKINPLSYYLRITMSTPGNALEIANEIFESGLVSYAQPQFWTDMLQCTWNPKIIKQWGLYNEVDTVTDINIGSAWNIATGDGVMTNNNNIKG